MMTTSDSTKVLTPILMSMMLGFLKSDKQQHSSMYSVEKLSDYQQQQWLLTFPLYLHCLVEPGHRLHEVVCHQLLVTQLLLDTVLLQNSALHIHIDICCVFRQICMSACMFVCLCVCVSVHGFIYLCLGILLSVYHFVCVSLCLCN